MSKLIEQAVTQDEDGTYGFRCPVNDGSCGGVDDKGTVVPFTSTGWPTKRLAQARGQQHVDDHKGIAPTPSLADFRVEHGLITSPAGVVAVRDL
ncbi:MAG TPA: hypothetical protein VFJ94_14510 [Intrasporangium sp.]|uniref:hypothetical protein n=1 Tax=Intrasporangium sp. TaxID=1925024 RepID=UPI002D79EDCB|nr:hypothetical protein [Intrasporangium sp.]HET7399726.1 hypothetical protein [Intrasporangium sp.]